MDSKLLPANTIDMLSREYPNVSLIVNPPYRQPGCKLYKRRWAILVMYVLYSALNVMQTLQYSIINNIVSKYYGVDSYVINWTTMIFMVVYIPLSFPASWLLNKTDLRIYTILGALGTAVGSWIKVCSVNPDRFVLTFVGQTIVAIFQTFTMNVPARLAAVWFSPNEVASACSLGVFGLQLGTAIGFLLPPIMVHNHDDLDLIGHDLSVMIYSIAGFTTIILVIIFIFFKAQPPLPPSIAQAEQRANKKRDFVDSLKQLFSNPNYILLVVSHGINVGCFCTITILLNQMVLIYFPDGEQDAGLIGLVMTVMGIVGAILVGIILDKTHKYKETAMAVYVLSLLVMIVFTFTLGTGHIGVVYFSGAMIGLLMIPYYPVGFELAAELTFPEPEGTSTGILCGSLQMFGIILTNLCSWIMENTTAMWANGAMCLALLLGLILTAFIKSDLRRQAVQGQRGPAAHAASHQ